MRRLLLASLLALAPAPAPGQVVSGQVPGQAPVPRPPPDPRASPDAARQATERARAAAAEEDRLATLRVDAATTLRQADADVAARADQVYTLAERRAAAAVRLQRHATALAPLLPLMERLALFPAETLLTVPAPPDQAIRGLGILRGMARTLEAEATSLRAEQDELAAEQQALDAALPGLRAAQSTQAAQAQALDQQIAVAHRLAQTLRSRADEAVLETQRRAAAEAARADSLHTALSTLDAARARAETQARDDAARADRQKQDAAAADARTRQEALARPPGPGLPPNVASSPTTSRLAIPVAGGVVRAWGEPTEAGPATGISFRPGPLARVVAPCAGRIRFAGPFRSFGKLMILDCGGGYAVVLAGLDRLDIAVGTTVLTGEPVGTMPGWDAASPAARPALYIELRHDGQPINPAPYLPAARRAQG